MASRVTGPKQVPKISTPNSLVVYSAAASARHLINYCLPVLHDYFMAKELDEFYTKFMTQEKARLGIETYEPMFEVAKTTESLVAHIKFMKDYYWSDSVLCPPHYKSVRSLISKEIVKMLNSEELTGDFQIVSPLCKFVIQLLFCYDVGDFSKGTVEVRESACQRLSRLLQCLGPFRVSSLDARSLEFALISPLEILLNIPNLEKIFVRDPFIGEKGLPLIAQMCSERLTEIGIERHGPHTRRSDLFEFLFKGKSKKEITWEDYKSPPTGSDITFPNLKRMFICCSTRTESFQLIGIAVRRFYTKLVVNEVGEPDFHKFCNMPLSEDRHGLLTSNFTRHFAPLIHASPVLRRHSVKFLNYDTYCNIKVLELGGPSFWFVRSNIETYLTRSYGNFDGLKLYIYPDMTHHYDPEATQYLYRNFEIGLQAGRQRFSLLLSNVGRTLLILTVQVTMAIDMREGLHCLNLCPVLREFTLIFNVVNFSDISPFLEGKINTLPELTKIVFHGELQMNSVRVNTLLRKIIKAAPNIRYLKLSGGLAKDIHLMSTDCFDGIDTLHLKNVPITKHYADHLTGVLRRCPDVRELVLKKVNDAEGWLKRVDKTTALLVRYVPEYCFLEEL